MDLLLELVLPALAVFSGFTGVLVAAFATYRRAAAERHFLDIVRRSEKFEALRELHGSFLLDGHMSDQELQRLTTELESYALYMKRKERRFIIEALQQSSTRGRERYVDKVLEIA